MKNTVLIKRIIHEIKSLFLNGLITILPLAITVAIFSYSIGLLRSWLAPVHRIEPACLQQIPYSEFILVIGVIFSLGAILRFLLLHEVIKLIEKPLRRIPLLREVYFGIKQIVHALSAQDKFSFQKVLLIPFPQQDTYSLGFMTGEVPSAIAPEKNKSYISVFVPTTPNPTTGFYLIVPEERCISTTLTRQEAMTIIMSGGVIKPERFAQAKE